MGNVIDYISWRGDLEFSQDEFNEVDNLIMSSIAYVSFEKLIKRDVTRDMTISEYGEYIDDEEPAYDKCIAEGVGLKILKAAAGSKRFGNVVISKYCSLYNKDKDLQFAAAEFILNENESYIAFRGTDNTIAGWKEDCLMAVLETEAEKEAVSYLNYVASGNGRKLYIGGHSKGAHLAVYAASRCYDLVWERIVYAFSNDGPGFTTQFVESEYAKKVEPKIYRIIPEESVVGMLLQPLGEPNVIKSSSRSIKQHDLLNWNVMGHRFVRAGKLKSNAVKADRNIKRLTEGLEEEEKISLINDLFAVLEAAEVDTLSELQNNIIKTIPLMKKRMNTLSPETKDRITDILKLLVKWKE